MPTATHTDNALSNHLLAALPAEEFARVHRSYIIALHRVENIRNKVIQLEGVEIPIGSSYEESFLKNFNK